MLCRCIASIYIMRAEHIPVMKISYNLLKEFLPQLDKNHQEIAEELSLKLAEVEGVKRVENDYMFEIENKALTHRPDCFSHWGIAREIGRPIATPDEARDILGLKNK